MKKAIWPAGLIALAAWSPGHAVVIDEATFKSYVGDTADVANTIKTHNDTLRSFSYERPWLAVGQLWGCTATWLGNKDGWSYVLTAAHCVNYEGTETPINKNFWGWDGKLAATGPGTAYVPPERIKKPAGMGGASTDIAILKLPTVNTIVDKAGKPVDPPILNDALDEKGRDVIYVGYGSWGVGNDTSGAYSPAKGDRRLYARSRIDSIFELDHGISASYQPAGPSPFWARTASGDSGSSWWQMRDGKPVIIATTNGGNGKYSTGPRVSMYADWIKSIYPDARFLSAEKPQGCIVSVNTGDRYCQPAGKTTNSLPSWIYGQDVYVDAAPGTAVALSDFENLAYNRIATFTGTVENGKLKQVLAANGKYLDFSKPHSMRVVSNTTPLGCIVSLTTSARYCLPPGQRSGYFLPSWIYADEVQVEAAPGTAVMLSDSENLIFGRVATFSGLTQNWELKGVKDWNGETRDFSRPKSMRVIQQ
ncbi:trypsin-like serine protease [Burkholderia sp. 22PA0106]|uniref:trypsin-like serine protease n=1 Tax=Burkholderia sp. 22PA0106 TaxID=3237371 RepID=UPI0039C30AE9